MYRMAMLAMCSSDSELDIPKYVISNYCGEAVPNWTRQMRYDVYCSWSCGSTWCVCLAATTSKSNVMPHSWRYCSQGRHPEGRKGTTRVRAYIYCIRLVSIAKNIYRKLCTISSMICYMRHRLRFGSRHYGRYRLWFSSPQLSLFHL